ncbi:diguanylate cyclase [Brevundimonas sp. 2R-24]|uniref:Diguanylate cyclase n=1 Tax=Peiella sedimenti TaxID=3061083 RepID=A0ABT8SLB8_9CAUL|nr:diguanylate cyclase [Caulobacteraceae bacterium XZ-24]
MTPGRGARILVVEGGSVGDALTEGLDRLGWRTVTATSAGAASAALEDMPIEAAVIDLAAPAETVSDLLEQIRARAPERRTPVLGIGEAKDVTADGFDLIMSGVLHPAQASLRLEQLIRAAVTEEELALRRRTLSRHGYDLQPQGDPRRSRVLMIGDPDPRFLALSHALDETEVETTGAFTAYTAFDYLHEKAFDAVVIWSGGDQTEAMSIATGMKRNTRLYHTPILLYLPEPEAVDVADLFRRGVADIAAPSTPEAETARRIAALAGFHRRQTAIREALEKSRSSGLMDPATGLFTAELFAQHLVAEAEAARGRRRPLSVCVLRLRKKPEHIGLAAGGWIARALPQIGSMVSRLVRAEDTTARLGPDTFALALPATDAAQAQTVGERIAAVIGCTAFDAGQDRPPFVAEFDLGVAELRPSETAGAALERAAKASAEAA